MVYNNIRINILFIFSLFVFTACNNQVNAEKEREGYEINVKIDGISDTVVFLGYYMRDQQYAQDTAEVDNEGNFRFKGNERLKGGMYFLLLPGQRVFDIIIDKEQHFSLSTSLDDMQGDLEIEGSKDNTLFFSYLQFLNEQRKIADSHSSELRELDENDDKERVTEIRRELRELNKRVNEYQKSIIEEHPERFLSVFIKMTLEPEIPDVPRLEDGERDHQKEFEYYRNHYFNNVDFSDERIIRTPVFYSKIITYLEDLTAPTPDSINKSISQIVEKARANDEVFRFVVSQLASKYEQSKIMGYDAVFVYMVENYYMSGDAFWVDEDRLKRIVERAEKLSPLLLGRQAPDLTMYGIDGRPVSLYGLDAKYTILYFWDSNCGHCRRITPKLLDIYDKYKDQGVAAFAVNIERDMVKWREYVNEHDLHWTNAIDPNHESKFRSKYDISSTPVLYLLDEEHKIVAKRISYEQVDDLLERFLNKE